jgi:L-threonine kinase
MLAKKQRISRGIKKKMIYAQDTKSISQLAERIGTGKAFGTFGELLQGRLWHEKRDFLVTLPIARYSYATFVADTSHTGITVFPPYKGKSKTLASMILQHYDLPCNGKLTIHSELPAGKGLASSSADLVATARSICSCFHIKIPLPLLATLMCKIEPSDGVMYSGVVSFYHRQGCLREFLGFLPPMTIVGIDEGGEMDTIQFNQRPKFFTSDEEMEYHHLLKTLSTAIRRQNVHTIGQVATRSALLNQRLNPKRMLNDVLAICKEIEGLGVVVTHSGTCLGILLSSEGERYQHQIQVAYQRLSALSGKALIYHSFHFV